MALSNFEKFNNIDKEALFSINGGTKWDKGVYLIGGAAMLTIGAPIFGAVAGSAATFALAYSAGISLLGIGFFQKE